MNQSNYLQQSEHCPKCHKNYFDAHDYCLTHTDGVNAEDCPYCRAQKFIAEKNKELENQKTDSSNFCAQCGKKLEDDKK